nr:unnamed protein product [Rangifer tarandus platyrhynchus]
MKTEVVFDKEGGTTEKELLGLARGSDLRERNSSSQSSSFSDGSSSRKNEPEARERETSNSYSDLETAIYGLAYKTLTQSQCSKAESPGSFMHVCTSESQGEAAGRHELMFQESRESFPSCERVVTLGQRKAAPLSEAAATILTPCLAPPPAPGGPADQVPQGAGREATALTQHLVLLGTSGFTSQLAFTSWEAQEEPP